MNKQELTDGLKNFYGTDNWYKHGLNPNMLYTDGVQFFAENAGGGCYWFLDICATELFQLQKQESFQSIHLKSTGSTAEITSDDGNDNVIYTRSIPFTDCPEGDWRFYLTDNVLLLTSEY